MGVDRGRDGIRLLGLITDGYGAYGGISQFNRDLIDALAANAKLSDIAFVARAGSGLAPQEGLRNVQYQVAKGGKAGFAMAALLMALRLRPQIVLIGHINFCWFGLLIARLVNARAVLIVYGGEAWRARRSAWVNRSVPKVDCVASISQLTLDRLLAWAPVPRERTILLPCSVDLRRFTPGPKPQRLLQAHGLAGRTVIMTMGRLAAQERQKGFDEIIEQLPRLTKLRPDLSYLICGKGSDEARLRQKARDLGVDMHVVFAGFVSEADKPDYYRMADAYVMPSRAEGFGIVILEALACGLPVLGSCLDGTGEVLARAQTGRVVDPRNGDDVFQGVLDVLERRPACVAPPRLESFSSTQWHLQVDALLQRVAGGASAP